MRERSHEFCAFQVSFREIFSGNVGIRFSIFHGGKFTHCKCKTSTTRQETLGMCKKSGRGLEKNEKEGVTLPHASELLPRR